METNNTRLERIENKLDVILEDGGFQMNIDFDDEAKIKRLIQKYEPATDRRTLRDMYSKIRFFKCRMWLMSMAGYFNEQQN